MDTTKALTDHISQYWSAYGVEVNSAGESSCTVTLPPRFPDIGDFIDDIWNEFSGTVDLEYDNKSVRCNITIGKPQLATESSSFSLVWSLFLVVCVSFVATLYLRRDTLRDDTHDALVYLLSLL